MSRRARLWIFAFVLAIVLVALVRAEIAYVSGAAAFTAAALLVGLVVWIVVRLFQRLLWRVGRRLAFTYFLIGVLPIPMVLALALLLAYLLAGFFAGHLYRDALGAVRSEVELAARTRVDGAAAASATAGPAEIAVGLARFRNGRRSGDRRIAAEWPAWLQPADGAPGQGERDAAQPLVGLADGTVTLAVAVGAAEDGVVAYLASDLAAELVRRSGIWIEIPRLGEPDEPKGITLQVGGRRFSLSRPDSRHGKARAEFFRDAADGSTSFLDRPLLLWAEIVPGARWLADGRPVAESVPILLNATPRQLVRHLFSTEAEVDTAAWAALFGLGILLLEIYGIAVIMAGYMIFGLSRATNRLYSAFQHVQGGDFAVRIPVRRKDQLGELQRSFNRMAENLQSLVASAAQKEVLEKELGLARELQRSLLPTDLGPATSEPGGGVRFATFFEPSAAIGGDYFDVLRLDRDRLAVVIADVAGHGLPAGLRMAMLKAALTILVEQEDDPGRILERLHRLVRGGQRLGEARPQGSASGRGGAARERGLVTATIGFVDLGTGTLQLVNAAHPPTYVIRGGDVREVLIPGNPLGGLGRTYGREQVALQPDDIVVWLSDGLFEATDGSGEPFGYERIVEALRGSPADATVARDRLLGAVRRWSGGAPAGDDQTLVVMHYRRPAGAATAATTPLGAEASGSAKPSVA